MSERPAPTPSTDSRLVWLSPDDNVCAVTAVLEAGQAVLFRGRSLTLSDRVPAGHKLAVVPIAAGQKVLKYGAPIGSAIRDIHAGEYVHTHNVKSDYLPTYGRGDFSRSSNE
jgi:altronate dehydratase